MILLQRAICSLKFFVAKTFYQNLLILISQNWVLHCFCQRSRQETKIPSVRHLEYLAKILPRFCQDFAKSLPRFCQDFASSGKNFEDIQDEILDLTKKSNIHSKNIFLDHVVLLQATLPETEQCPYSEVEALC